MNLKKSSPRETGVNGFSKATSSAAIIFALVMLFNPNINIIDILPDFLGYFILARQFERAADCAPYFEEARAGFFRLGIVSIMKIPALLIAMFARSANTMDNDIVVLLTLVFTIAEICIIITAVNNIFAALGYLGQRTDAISLISYSASLDDLKSFSMVFLIGKSVLCFIPETLKLTRSVDIGGSAYYQTGSPFYTPVLSVALIIVTVIGIAWLYKMICYVRFIKAEGKFDVALLSLASATAPDEYENNRRKRAVYRGFALISFSSVLTFRLHFDNYYDVNLIPQTLFGIAFCLGLFIISGKLSCKKTKWGLWIISGLYTVVSCISYILSTKFLVEYGYSELYLNLSRQALEFYRLVMIFSAIELVLIIGLSIVFVLIMRSFYSNELSFKTAENERKHAMPEYIRMLNKKSMIFALLCAITGAVKFIDVCIHSDIQLIFTSDSDITMPSVFAPSVPWFNTVVALASVIFAIYAFYYFGYIKSEIEEKMKGFSIIEEDQQ